MADIRNPSRGQPAGGGIGLRNSADLTLNDRNSQPPAPTAVIRKNSAEEIRVGLSEYNGHDLINIRVWADPRNGGRDRIPTKAGIACNVRLLPELIEALREAEAQARAGGLL